MDRRRRASSTASKSLLDRQLASIADTLAKASQRRDEEVKRFRRPSKALTTAAKPASLSKSAAAVPVNRQGHECLESVGVQLCSAADEKEVAAGLPDILPNKKEERSETLRKEYEKLDRMFFNVQGQAASRKRAEKAALADNVAERERAERKRREEEFEHMLHEMVAEDARCFKEEMDMKRVTAEAAERTKTRDEALRRAEREAEVTEDARRTKSSDTSCFELSMPSKQGGELPSIDHDPKAVLAELHSLRGIVHLMGPQDNEGSHDRDELRRMLAEFDRSSSSFRTTAAADNGDDPQRILAELATLSGPGHPNVSWSTNKDCEDEEDDDISILHARLQNLRSRFDETPSWAPTSTVFDKTRTETVAIPPLDSKAIPYVVALELERSNSRWEHVQGWTKYLFSTSPDSYEAQQDCESAVLHAEDALNRIIDSVMRAEQDALRKAEETKLQKRLVVSNLAAGAEKDEIERQLWQHRCDIVGITFLPERDPLKRTQTAHVDMSSRKAAIRASYITGQVYGLIFDVKLAVRLDGLKRSRGSYE